ncbi:anti-sigma factor [Arcanobacterium canis]|uniref:Anti-sigma factor n=1 Tax=Arcanobacterium canis TaxID=999183 RepID=A0ABY8G173_9ACTO|nr:anti-sigma factor [Arcanobacterium canis]WFM83101.1 anti-sigma factor [Arcanobacterium canis]
MKDDRFDSAHDNPEFGTPEAEVLGVLGASLAPTEPPAHVRENLMALIGANNAQPPLDNVRHEADVVDISRRRRWSRVAMNAAAAVALVVVGVGVGRWSAMGSMENVSHYAALNEAQDVERAMTTMDDGHKVTLTWSQSMDMAAVTFPAELRAPRGQSLQVWVEMDGKITSGGIYAPGKDGSFSFVKLMPEPGAKVFVTIEPAGGSSAPTSAPIIEWTISADGGAQPSPTPQSEPGRA